MKTFREMLIEKFSDENFETILANVKKITTVKSHKEFLAGAGDKGLSINILEMPSQDYFENLKKMWDSDYKITVTRSPLKLSFVIKS